MVDPRVAAVAVAVAEQTQLGRHHLTDEFGQVCALGAFGYALLPEVKAKVTTLRYSGDELPFRMRWALVAEITDACLDLAWRALGYPLVRKIHTINDLPSEESAKARRDRVLRTLQAGLGDDLAAA